MPDKKTPEFTSISRRAILGTAAAMAATPALAEVCPVGPPAHDKGPRVWLDMDQVELDAAYDHVLEQFALELLIGADKNSDWYDGKLVIDANHGPIHLLQTAFYAVRLEVQRRKLA